MKSNVKKLVLVNLYPEGTLAPYLLSSYILKGYLDKYLQKKSLTIEVLDRSAMDEAESVREAILARQPDFIGYSCYVWNVEKIRQVMDSLSESKHIGHILGGPEISVEKSSMFAGDDLKRYFIVGEGERILLNLMRYLLGDEKEGALPKGVVRFVDGEAQYEPHTDRITDLDEIPSVYLDGIIDDSLYEHMQAFLETQRGCRFKCKYCVYHKNLSGISFYSLDRVKKEIKHLIVDKHICALRIFDSIFTHDLARAKEIVRYLIELKESNDIAFPWIYWEFSYDTVDEEFLGLVTKLKHKPEILNSSALKPFNRPQFYRDMLKDYTVVNCIGVQSFNDESLRAVHRRKINRGRFDVFMHQVKACNIVLKVDLIFGLPFETIETYFSGLEYFLPYFEATDHVLNIHQLQILPDSELADDCERYAIQYSQTAPYYVLATNSLSEKDFEVASKLTALLFRMVNSPLRQDFFNGWKSSGKSLKHFLDEILTRLSCNAETRETRLVQDVSVNDIYWNSTIFHEIPSNVLANILSHSVKTC